MTSETLKTNYLLGFDSLELSDLHPFLEEVGRYSAEFVDL